MTPGPEALDQGVGALHHSQQRLHAAGILEIEPHALPSPIHQILRGMRGVAAADRSRPIDTQYLGSHVGQQHGGKRTGTNACNFKDLRSVEGTHIDTPPAQLDLASNHSCGYPPRNRLR